MNRPANKRSLAPHDLVVRPDLVTLGAAGLIYLTVVAIGYGLNFEFVCRANFWPALCQSLSLAVPRTLSLLGMTLLLLVTRPEIRALHRALWRPAVHMGWLLVLVSGAVLTLVPLAASLVSDTLLPPVAMLTAWLLGLVGLTSGSVGALYRSSGWVRTPLRTRLSLLAAVGAALILPELALSLQPVWRIELLTDVTFQAVASLLDLLGQSTFTNPAVKVIAIDDFSVAIGPQCSGVEGFALISAFMTLYIVLFSSQLRIGRALWLLPVGICLSWVLNVVRITVLVLIGRYISPDLAADGFHSHAGWLAFTVLAVSLALAAHAIPWFRAGQVVADAPQDRFFEDPAVVYILPFAVFMMTATLSASLVTVPGLAYPLRMAAVTVVLALGWRVLLGLRWEIDLSSVTLGALCGVVWVLTAPPAEAADSALAQALADLPLALFVGWVIIRVLGTSVVVPVLEELFFRGYLQVRIAEALPGSRIVTQAIAIAVSAGLFAALHDRWLAAALAGILFGLLAVRRGRVTDAIVGHAAANAVIALAAVLGNDWHLI